MKTKFASVGKLIICLILISGCASAPVKKDLSVCYAPDNKEEKIEAPGWVCDKPYAGLAVQAWGAYAKSAAGLNHMKHQAAAQARVTLANQLKVQVQSMIKAFTETTGTKSNETVDAVSTSVTKQISNETLVGSKIFESWVNDKSGDFYVLVGIDEAQLQTNAKKAVMTSLNNDAALWQQFKASKSNEELASEIAKLPAK